MVHELDTSKVFMCSDDIFSFKEGHYHISGNQQNFVLLPTFVFLLFSSTLISHLPPHPPRKVHCQQGTQPGHHQENNATLHPHSVLYDKHKPGK